MRLTAAVAATVLLTAVFGAGVAGARDGALPPELLGLTTSAPLFPTFSPGVTDYVVACSGSSSTRISTVSAAGTVPEIDGKQATSLSLPLRADEAVTVTGTRGRQTVAYHVRCLPPDFPSWQATGPGASGRLYITAPSLSLGAETAHYVVIYDGHGVPLWWYRDAGVPIDAKLLPGKEIAFANFDAPVPSYQVRRLDGTLVRRVQAPDGSIDDHDLQTDSAGNEYYLVYQPRRHVDLTSLGGPADATVYDGQIEERSPTGRLLWSWSTDGHVGLDELAGWRSTIAGAPVTVAGSPVYDIVHANSVSVLGNVVLLSLRYANAVYAIDRGTGAILWKVGGTTTPQSLTVTGDPLGAQPLVGQHDARLLPDGTITIFDDGSFVRAPRAVRYRIDTSARTAAYVSSVADPAVTASPCCGSARLLADGHWLVSWGGDSTVGEYAADGTPLLKLDFPGLFSYRAIPVATAKLSPAALRAGMDAMASRAS